jgi:hypothetical protein
MVKYFILFMEVRILWLNFYLFKFKYYGQFYLFIYLGLNIMVKFIKV